MPRLASSYYLLQCSYIRTDTAIGQTAVAGQTQISALVPLSIPAYRPCEYQLLETWHVEPVWRQVGRSTPRRHVTNT